MTQTMAKPKDEATANNKAPRYHVASVEKATGPGGMEGKNWHRYVLGGVRSPISWSIVAGDRPANSFGLQG